MIEFKYINSRNNILFKQIKVLVNFDGKKINFILESDKDISSLKIEIFLEFGQDISDKIFFNFRVAFFNFKRIFLQHILKSKLIDSIFVLFKVLFFFNFNLILRIFFILLLIFLFFLFILILRIKFLIQLYYIVHIKLFFFTRFILFFIFKIIGLFRVLFKINSSFRV